ncbi:MULTISPECIES: hypothetical protein [unclassified Mesorhizobium]|nr:MULTISPECIES: hypothetical protein [unclassified Mesorhizobium]
MKKPVLIFALVALALSACDNKLPPTKAPGADQDLAIPVVNNGIADQ